MSDFLELAGACNAIARTEGEEALGALNIAAGNTLTPIETPHVIATAVGFWAGAGGLSDQIGSNDVQALAGPGIVNDRLVCDGTQDYETTSPINLGANSEGTWLVAYNKTDNGNQYQVPITTSVNGGQGPGWGTYVNNVSGFNFANGGDAGTNQTNSIGGGAVFDTDRTLGGVRRASGEIEIIIDGVLGGSPSPVPAAQDWSTTNGVHLGWDEGRTANQYLEGEIIAAAFWDRELDQGEITQASDYLLSNNPAIPPPSIQNSPYREFAGVLNQLAGTTGLEAAGAANALAGTTGLELVAALNVAAGGGAVDPTQLVTWNKAYWTGGTRFQALGLSDMDPLATWPNETSVTNDLSAAAPNRPTYRSAGGPIGQPIMRSSASTEGLQGTYAPDTYTQPYTVVVVGASSDLTAGRWMFSGLTLATRHGILISAGPVYRHFAGANDNSTETVDTNWHLHTCYSEGTGSAALEIDGVLASGNGTNIGTNSVSGITVGCNFDFTGGSLPDIEFVGVFDGDARTDPGWAEFEAWALTRLAP